MAAHWQFVEGYEADSSHWSWRVIGADGTLDNQSPQFSTYGRAVSDALTHGFQPRQQHWTVVTRHQITHFRPGQPPLSVPVNDDKPSYRTRNPKTRAADAGARSQGSPEKPEPTPSLRGSRN